MTYYILKGDVLQGKRWLMKKRKTKVNQIINCIFARQKKNTMIETFSQLIAAKLEISRKSVMGTLRLLDDGCTIPFIARYRKEHTGSLDEVQIEQISNEYIRLKELAQRKETILKTIRAQEKLTPELEQRINESWNETELEDIYLPYKPRRRTRAQVAREQGLEPLAQLILKQREPNPREKARGFLNDEVKDVDAAILGAQDILAEQISENEQARQQLRQQYQRFAVITSKVIKSKADTDEAAKYRSYFKVEEPLRRCSANRLLAMRRGENEGYLRVSINVDDDRAIDRLCRQFVHGRGACSTLVEEACEDAYQRLLQPSIENEFAALSKQKADDDAIAIFRENLRQLLLSSPLGQKRVLAIDPGFRTGCKVVCLDSQGHLLHHDVMYPHPPQRYHAQSMMLILDLMEEYNIEAVAIGNGTASRETKEFIDETLEGKDIPVFVVSEDGASIYSASEIARKEFPDEDVTVRGAVSIGRRLIDPLAELVKIDPKSLGVGQYQHDVDQTKLKKGLDQVVESCVNTVGVNLNTASEALLTYVSGLGPALAKNIVDYRKENGAFQSRKDLLKVPRIGKNAFTQCAGFLRISNPTNPLDNSAVHPERYALVEQMAKDCGCDICTLMSDAALRQEIDLNRYLDNEVGLPTLQDIMKELEKPGRDPRTEIEAFEFDPTVHTIDDLREGMVLPGIVTNITQFGAFVDIGVHQDGLIHVSQMADHFVSDPTQVVRLHQQLKVKVIEVDLQRHRIALSLKGVQQ